jgi:hypothetical protein
VTSPREKKFPAKKYCCREFFAAMQSFKDMLEDSHRLLPKLCLCSGEKQKKWFLKAEEWFNEKRSEWIFWLENICEALRLDPRYLRKG